jgi:hypothetical protein
MDGPRRADVVLRVISSWIVDHDRWHNYDRKQVDVFGHMEDFSYLLQNPGTRVFMQDVYSLLAPADAFCETGAVIDFADGALAIDEPAMAYSLLASVMRSFPEKWADKRLREAMEVSAHACGDTPVMLSGQSITALRHFEEWRAQQEQQMSFRELLRVPVWSNIICDIDTNTPRKGTSSGVTQEPTTAETAVRICCMVLAGVCHLGAIRARPYEGTLSPEDKALETLRMFWEDLDQNTRDQLSRHYNIVTCYEFAHRYGL